MGQPYVKSQAAYETPQPRTRRIQLSDKGQNLNAMENDTAGDLPSNEKWVHDKPDAKATERQTIEKIVKQKHLGRATESNTEAPRSTSIYTC